jgi:hypothetical protein
VNTKHVSGYGKTASSHILRQTHIYNCTQQSPNLRSCSASWRWASNARNMTRHWTSIKWKWKWSVHQVGMCLLRNYVTMMHGQQNTECFIIYSERTSHGTLSDFFLKTFFSYFYKTWFHRFIGLTIFRSGFGFFVCGIILWPLSKQTAVIRAFRWRLALREVPRYAVVINVFLNITDISWYRNACCHVE